MPISGPAKSLLLGSLPNARFWVISGPSWVLVEPVFPVGQWVGRAAGIALIAWGSATLLV
ncbi:hypothetical protein NKI95_29115 [Mesorhizobium sp. M0306]|uniref:hypothetical protein n=1 Tax=Mesorhizobium sp. M0306 TaxID=2956932 RepID=UPI00333BEE5A